MTSCQKEGKTFQNENRYSVKTVSTTFWHKFRKVAVQIF